MRIFLVDDEALICRYIVKCIQEAGREHEVIGTASSGTRALEQIEALLPDLVLTDITMPKMDGLELLCRIKERWPEMSVVMLTCHDDFELVRQAMHNRADDYILKAEITPEFIGRKLQKVKEQRQKSNTDRIVGTIKQANLLRSITNAGERSVYLVTENDLRESHILLKDEAFVAVAFGNAEINISSVMQALPAEFENFLLYHASPTTCVLLSNIKTSSALQNREEKERYVNLYLTALSEQLRGEVGRSRIYYRLQRLSMAIGEAAAALVKATEERFYGVPAADGRNEEEISRALEWQGVAFSARLEEKDLHRSCRAVMDTLEFAEQHHPNSTALKERLMQMLDLLTHQDGIRVAWSSEEICEQSSLPELRDWLTARLKTLEQAGRRYSPSIRKAIDHMVAHYGEDLTLNMVADHVFLNREYLSRQFKKEVGVTFSEYLLDLRMKEALRLLRGSDLLIGEVAERVGLPNVSHFTSVFKRKYHVTPSEARKQGAPERGTDKSSTN